MTNAIRGAASNFFLFFDIFVASTMNRIVAFAGFSQIADKGRIKFVNLYNERPSENTRAN